jgi:hypothetical protein
MTQSKVLFDDVAFFRNLFISLYFIFGQFRRLGVFSHYAVFDVVKSQKVPVRFSSPGGILPSAGSRSEIPLGKYPLSAYTFSMGCLV